LTHIFPDAIDEYDASLSDKLHGYPLPFVIAIVTLLFIIAAERAILTAMQKHKQPSDLTAETNIVRQPVDDDEEDPHRYHSHVISFPLKEDGSIKAQAYLLTIGICFHSIFEGLALGFASDVAGIIVLMIAILIHKTFEALALSNAIAKMQVSRTQWGIILSIFAFTAPMGIVIAILVKEQADDYAESIVSSIVNSVATGIFLYISFVTLLEELVCQKQRLLKLVIACSIVIATGFLVFLE
jgi:zinc transporter ZupT